MTTEKKHGRPTDYRAEYDDLAYKFCLLGATDKKLAECFEVRESTINNWKIAHPSFMESIKRGKAIADGEVVNSLFKRATGYTCKETKIATNEGQITDSKEFDKHHAPDTTAAIFWLKNRQPAQWRDKQEMDHSITVSKADDSEW